MNALELAKQKSLKVRKNDHDSDDDPLRTSDAGKEPVTRQGTTGDQSKPSSNNANGPAELAAMNKMFETKVDDLKMCLDLINRHYQALHRTLNDLEQIDKSEATGNIIKSVNERATLFRITSTGKFSCSHSFTCVDRGVLPAMLNACQESVQLIQNQGRKWQKAIQFERDARQRMERMCEQVATQSAKLEKQIQRASRKSKAGNPLAVHSTSSALKSLDAVHQSGDENQSSDDEEFHDAVTDSQTLSVFRIP